MGFRPQWKQGIGIGRTGMQMRFTRREFARLGSALGLASAAGLVGGRPVLAAPLPKPQGKVVLTISGKITNTNEGDKAEFDMPMIEAIGIDSFMTKTPWYKDPVTFSGVPMAKLFQFVGASGTSVTVTALNDYATDIPIEDFKTYPVLLATKRDGAYMPVRDKGPLFIVYDYDSNAELQHQRFYSRSAWQVVRMVVK
jgi:hypothetical protein